MLNENRRFEYGVEVDWTSLPPHTDSLVGVDPNVESMRFRRVKGSHRGISQLSQLRKLVVFCVNQECLEEIAALPRLETLYMSQMSAVDPSCLSGCRNLRHLIIKGGTKVPSLSWLSRLPPLESLLLEHFKMVTDFSAVAALSSLKALGIEGSIWASQRCENFKPVALLPALEALVLTNCRPKSDGIRPLHRLERLRYLEIAAFYADEEFLALRRAIPKLECEWFEQIDQYGSIKASIKARTTG
jgi:hypothetical protein